jgi:hypothetical protein
MPAQGSGNRGAALAWASEEILSASKRIGDRRAVLGMSRS